MTTDYLKKIRLDNKIFTCLKMDTTLAVVNSWYFPYSVTFELYDGTAEPKQTCVSHSETCCQFSSMTQL